MKRIKGPERHLTFTKETPYESKYLTHRVLPHIGATGAVHAEQVGNVFHEFNSENTIKAILVDKTNANTGCKGGMVAILEKKFFLIFTQLVPLCTIMNYLSDLFKNIDGCAKGPTAFSGPLEKLCSKDCHDLLQKHFPLLADLWIQFEN